MSEVPLYIVSSSLPGPVVPSFRALSGRLKFTARRHKFNQDSLSPLRAGGTLSSQFKNNYFTEMCSGSEAGSYSRLINCVYHSTLGLRVIKKKKRRYAEVAVRQGAVALEDRRQR